MVYLIRTAVLYHLLAGIFHSLLPLALPLYPVLSCLKMSNQHSRYPPLPAPCPPVDIEKSVSCDNHTASISWSAVPGAVTYTATLEQTNGSTTCCTTSETSCDITDLPCGEIYILHVMAGGRTCNSSLSDGDILRTGMEHTHTNAFK